VIELIVLFVAWLFVMLRWILGGRGYS